MFEIYCDGACSNNGSKDATGGWAFVVVQNGKIIHHSKGAEKNTTNQRMELIACINACDWLVENFPLVGEVKVNSDSAYLCNCYSQNWWRNWEVNGWHNSKKEPVANTDLWKRLIPFFEMPNYTFLKVKGHAGNTTESAYWNDVVDKMAVEARSSMS